MAEERDTGLLAPLAINTKAYKYARDLRKQEDTNYDEIDNKYDAIRHIGGALALYSQYPDMASDVILEAKEIFSGDTARGTEMDRHNNAIAKKLYAMLPEEQADQLTTEQALEIAKSYVEEWELAEEEGREIDLPEDMKPIYYYKEGTKSTEMRQGGGVETEAGKEMAKEKFQLDERKADLNKDGELSAYEKTRGEAVQRAMGEGKETKMAMGGMMSDPFAPLQVVIGIDEESGNGVPAGSKDEEVRDDIPAMLSEGEYVVPADVVRYHGLKTFEALRGEAKHAMGLMAMHDRISFVDDETKEPVEYDIEEKDKPEVEEAEVKVVEAAEGTDVQPTTEPITYYQLQYRMNPRTGRTEMVYVDPLTNQVVSEDTFEQERASRFAPQTVLERQGIVEKVAEDIADEEEEEPEAEAPSCPVGQVYNPTTGRCEDISGDGPEPTTAPGPSYGYTNAELDAALGKQLTNYTAPVPTQVPGVVASIFPGAQVIANVVDEISGYFTRNSALNQIRAGENLGVAPTADYADFRSGMNNAVAGSVAITEQEAKDAVANDSIQGTSFGSKAEAEAVATHGWGSDEAIDAIESGFSRTTTAAQDRENALAAVSDGSENKYGSGLRRGNDYRTSLEDQGYDMTTFDEARGPGKRGGWDDGTEDTSGNTETEEDDDLNVSDDDFGMNKGGMPVRNNTPRKAMIKY